MVDILLEAARTERSGGLFSDRSAKPGTSPVLAVYLSSRKGEEQCIQML
jgi:hypothetical protein